MRMQASAFAPASVGNIGVGFDILGHSIAGPGDRVSVRRIEQRDELQKRGLLEGK